MTMRQIKTIQVSTAGTASNWIELNSKFGDNNDRAFCGDLVAGDTARLEFSMTPEITPTTGSVARYVATSTFSSSPFNGVYGGGWRWVRLIKTGSNGALNVDVEL